MPMLLDVLWALVVGAVKGTYDLIKRSFPKYFEKSVSGDVAVITGAGSGIGRMVAQRLAKLGAIVVSVDVNEKGNKQTAEEVRRAGGVCHTYKCDLTQRDAVYATFAKIREEVGPVSILVNNAGVVAGSRILDSSDDKIDLTFKVNVISHFWTIKSVLGDMIDKQKGHIVTVASAAGYNAMDRMTDYCSSKFAAVGLHESLRVELDHLNLTGKVVTTVIAPFFINTGMFKGVNSSTVTILEADYVADQVVKAILIDQETVILPEWFKYLQVLKPLLHSDTGYALHRAFKTYNSMDSFTGRK